MQLTPSATLPSAPFHFTPDPIANAGQLLRRAARLPFEAKRPRAWARQFTHLATDARTALVAHILRAERADSAFNQLSSERPEFRHLIDRQTSEHKELLLQIFRLVEDAQVLRDPGIWDMVEFSEKAKLLELALERHHSRMVDIAYEAACREIGGEAG
ncbi:MAG: hypothetical protein M0R74_05060 [Dehalococcoidia bacterium]|nr:hypothetical protein [Dehalococcoidia bacterium]